VAVFESRGPMKLCQQFPSLGHRNQYRPMLGPSRHASELQALVHGFAILVGVYQDP
jgi:hypothetical protein